VDGDHDPGARVGLVGQDRHLADAAGRAGQQRRHGINGVPPDEHGRETDVEGEQQANCHE
jgi:hypothetical protein